MRTSVLTQLPFLEAAQTWLETRRPYLSRKTIYEYELNIKTLAKYFGNFRLTEISADQLRAYQRMRLTECGPFSINHECSIVQQMLKRIGRWQDIGPEYQPLPLPKEKRGRALRDEQRALLFRISAENPNWRAAYLFASISVNTTAGPKETATLRIKDIDHERRTIRVQPEGAKNVHRIRVVPLNDESLEAVRMAVARAMDLGATEPDHYLFPFRRRGSNNHRASYDPTRHQTTFKTAWNAMTLKAGLPGFRMYDLRHHAITVLLENPDVSEETAEAIAGHISREMKKRYSHVRMETKRAAIEALAPKRYNPPKKSTDTEKLNTLLTALTKMLKTG